MKAKNTSPKAYVCRFNGGQFAIDSDEGVNKKHTYGERIADYKSTNLDGPAGPSKRSGAYAATVRTSANVSSQVSGKKTPEFTNANVGGGHTRKHQG